MSYVLALFLPFLAVMLKGRPILGLLLLVLQLTLIGWLPAVFIAFVVIHHENSRRAFQRRLLRSVRNPPLDLASVWAGITGNRAFGQNWVQRLKSGLSTLQKR